MAVNFFVITNRKRLSEGVPPKPALLLAAVGEGAVRSQDPEACLCICPGRLPFPGAGRPHSSEEGLFCISAGEAGSVMRAGLSGVWVSDPVGKKSCF